MAQKTVVMQFQVNSDGRDSLARLLKPKKRNPWLLRLHLCWDVFNWMHWAYMAYIISYTINSPLFY